VPFGDGTGPMGMGPMIGRGAGYCGGYGRPGFTNPAFGPAGGYGYGYRGYGYPGYGALYGYSATPYAPPIGVPPASVMNSEQEYDYLKNQVQIVRSQLEQIESRMRELEKK
jgi:hypothetical protein